MNCYVVDREGLQNNIRILREKAGATPIYGVIKGNGYGLGLLPMAQALAEGGVDRFAVTEPKDIRALREAGFQQEILMMRATCVPEELTELLALDAVCTVGSLDCALAMDRAAAEAGKKLRCHVKIDTGMGRYGFLPSDLDGIRQVYALENLEICGIYTHFHSAFSSEKDTKGQFNAFMTVIRTLEGEGYPLETRHCCNSSAFLKYPEMYLDGVRLGSALLGRLSFPGDMGLTKLGWCRSQVELIRELPKGSSVGYGAAWRAKRPTKIAVCSVGYFNGFGAEKGNDIFRFRDCVRGGLGYIKAFLKKKAFYVTVNGKPARVLGHIGMVQTIFDVTDIPCQVGDPVRMEINPLLVKDLPVVFE